MRRTLGTMSNSRGTWGVLKPVTRVKDSNKIYNRKKDKINWKKVVD